jgi:hypothetical protein
MAYAEEDLERYKDTVRSALKEAYMRGWSDAIIAVYKENLGVRWDDRYIARIQRIMLQDDGSSTDSEEK